MPRDSRTVYAAGYKFPGEWQVGLNNANVEMMAAIADQHSTYRGEVKLSPGRFNCDSAIQMVNRSSLRGEGHESTELRTTKSGFNIVEFHGSGITNATRLTHAGLSDLLILGSGTPDTVPISMLHADKNFFRNIHIGGLSRTDGFDNYGMKIVGCFDNHFTNMFIEWCGSTTNSKAAVLISDSSQLTSNANKFYDTRIEPFHYRGLQLDGVVGGAGKAHANHFYGLKVHGDNTNNTYAIYVAGNRNIFTGTVVEVLGEQIAIYIADTGLFNQFLNTQAFELMGSVFEVQGASNLICGVQVDGGDKVGDGIALTGSDNILSDVVMGSITGWGITVAGSRNHLSDVVLSAVNGVGVIVTGSDNDFQSVSPLFVGETAGEAMEVSGDNNRIVGGKFHGPSNKTIQFNAGADNNRVIGARVTKTIIDNGSGNVVSDVDGSTDTNAASLSSPLVTTGILEPPQITANQNDYAPTGLATATVLSLDLDANRSLTGIAAQPDGTLLIIWNGSAFSLTLENASGSSAAENRFVMLATLTVRASQAVVIQYDATADRWRLLFAPTIQATAANMEAETATFAIVTPDLVRRSPGVGKFAGRIISDGTLQTGSYNVTGVVHTATGRYTITIGTDFSGTLWIPGAALIDAGATGSFDFTAIAAGTVELRTYIGGVLADCAAVFWGFGDQ